MPDVGQNCHGVIMSGEISVNMAGLPSVLAPRSAANQPPSLSTASAASASAAPATTAATAQTPFLNPQMTIDPALGISVIEFLSTTGAVVNSIPSQHQLEMYRQAQAGPQAGSSATAPGTMAPAATTLAATAQAAATAMTTPAAQNAIAAASHPAANPTAATPQDG
jgi:hypothetical protein